MFVKFSARSSGGSVGATVRSYRVEPLHRIKTLASISVTLINALSDTQRRSSISNSGVKSGYGALTIWLGVVFRGHHHVFVAEFDYGTGDSCEYWMDISALGC